LWDCDARLKLAGSKKPYLLGLTGAHRGVMLEGYPLETPALDMASVLDVVVEDPAPFEMEAKYYEAVGLVCEVGAGSGNFIVRAKLQSRHVIYVDLIGQKGHATTDKPAGAPLWIVGLVGVAPKPSVKPAGAGI
jgi:hypothetical protein